MADLIERSEIVAVAKRAFDAWNLAMATADGQREINLCFKRQELCKAVKAVAEAAPAVDAVQVVRCKNCKLCRKRNLNVPREAVYAAGVLWCSSCGMPVLPDDFCSGGVQK